MINIIAAIGKNNELGLNGDLCFRIKDDLKYFKETTLGHKVLMGINTYRSLPNGALKGRENIVLTHQDVSFPNVEIIHSIDEALKIDDVFAIGGASIYKQFIDFADNIYLTEIDAEADADVYFPSFDKSKYDRRVLKTGVQDDLSYSFVLYSKK